MNNSDSNQNNNNSENQQDIIDCYNNSENQQDSINCYSNFVKETFSEDIFSSLLINTKSYSKTESTGEFGIEFDKYIHKKEENPRILDFQAEAALDMLQNRRGFGIFNGDVGTGKTFEVGVALSELAARNLLQKILIIIPDNNKNLAEHWKNTLEKVFGMGIDKTKIIDNKNELDFSSDVKAYIITTQVYINKYDDIRDNMNSSINTIVIDEFHEFYKNEEIKNNKEISDLIIDNIYFFGLTATLHEGNLMDMYDLWQFIEKRGNNNKKSEDLDKKKFKKLLIDSDNDADNINDENFTLNDFLNIQYKMLINKFKRPDSLTDDEKKISDVYSKLSKKEIYNYIIAGDNHIYDNISDLKGIASGECDEDGKGELNNFNNLIDEYIRKKYYNFIHKIAVTSEKNPELTNKKGKECINCFFLPSHEFKKQRIIISKYNLNHYNNDSFVEMMQKQYLENNSIYEYRFINEDEYKTFFQDCFNIIFENENDKQKNDIDSYDFYGSLFAYGINKFENSKNCLIKTNIDDEFAVRNEKIQMLLNICKLHYNENNPCKILIFFDLPNTGKESCSNSLIQLQIEKYKTLIDDVNEIIKLCKRDLRKFKLYSSNKYNINNCIISDDFIDDELTKFNDSKDNSIYLVLNSGLKHGTNMQAANILINFSITSDLTSMIQILGRISRIDQKKEQYIYNFADMSKLEGLMLAFYIKSNIFCGGGENISCINGIGEKYYQFQCPSCGKIYLLDKNSKGKKCENENCEGILSNTPTNLVYKCSEYYLEDLNDSGFSDSTSLIHKCNKCKLSDRIRYGTITFTSSAGYTCFAGNDILDRGFITYKTTTDERLMCHPICVLKKCDIANNYISNIKDCKLNVDYYRQKISPDSLFDDFCKKCYNYNKCYQNINDINCKLLQNIINSEVNNKKWNKQSDIYIDSCRNGCTFSNRRLNDCKIQASQVMYQKIITNSDNLYVSKRFDAPCAANDDCKSEFKLLDLHKFSEQIEFLWENRKNDFVSDIKLIEKIEKAVADIDKIKKIFYNRGN